MERLLLIAVIVVFFYLLVPGLGAFAVRARWRTFRRQLLRSSMHPIADYEQFRLGGTNTEGTTLGTFRFFGSLEAIQGDDLIWVRNGQVSFAANMHGVRVYTLYPIADKEPGLLPDQAPQVFSWSRMGSLPEGTKVYLGGSLEVDHGRATFLNRKDFPLTVIIYDGTEESLLARSIWSARQRNEYWNQFTAPSLLAGTFALLLLSYVFLRTSQLRLEALTSLTLAIVPVVPLLPPGIIAFFLYRHWWRKGRYFRAQRDLVRLPLRYFPDEDVSTGRGGWIPGLSVGASAGGGVRGRRSDRAPGAEAEGAVAVLLPGGEQYVRVSLDSDQTEALKTRGASERTVPELRRGAGEFEARRFVFGVAAGKGSERESRDEKKDAMMIVAPADPMAEFLVYQDDPSHIAAACAHRARRNEVVAGVSFGIGFLVNLYEVFLFLSFVVR